MPYTLCYLFATARPAPFPAPLPGAASRKKPFLTASNVLLCGTGCTVPTASQGLSGLFFPRTRVDPSRAHVTMLDKTWAVHTVGPVYVRGPEWGTSDMSSTCRPLIRHGLGLANFFKPHTVQKEKRPIEAFAVIFGSRMCAAAYSDAIQLCPVAPVEQ